MLKEAEAEKQDAVQIDGSELMALLSEIEPMLEKGDFSASAYVEKLQSIEGMEGLAERIDDYDFEGALKLLKELLP